VAVLPREASYEDFCDYVIELRGDVPAAEIDELWTRRHRLLGLMVNTGRGYRAQLPPDEQHLTREERGRKAEKEALSQGRNIERLPDKAQF
jgi:hypothetical protein